MLTYPAPEGEKLFPDTLHNTEFIRLPPEIVDNRNISLLRLSVLRLASFNMFHQKRILGDRHDGVCELFGEVCNIIENWGRYNAMLERERTAKSRTSISIPSS